MFHNEHSATVVVVGVCNVVRELTPLLTLFLPALLFVVAGFSAVPALERISAIAQSGVMTPPCAKLPGAVSVHMPLVGVALLVLSALAVLATPAATLSSSSIEA